MSKFIDKLPVSGSLVIGSRRCENWKLVNNWWRHQTSSNQFSSNYAICRITSDSYKYNSSHLWLFLFCTYFYLVTDCFFIYKMHKTSIWYVGYAYFEYPKITQYFKTQTMRMNMLSKDFLYKQRSSPGRYETPSWLNMRMCKLSKLVMFGK